MSISAKILKFKKVLPVRIMQNKLYRTSSLGAIFIWSPHTLFFFKSPESLRWPIAMGWHPYYDMGRPSCIYIFFSRTTGPNLAKFGMYGSICRVRRQEIVNSWPPTPKGENFGAKCLKLMYFFTNFLLYPGAWFRQIKCIVMMTKEGSTKI